MSVTWSKRSHSKRGSTSWTSVAFIVESMLLLVFLIGSLAVLTQVFSTSLNRSVESRTLDAATIAAGSIAEHFIANPEDVQEETLLGDLRIECDTTEERHVGGTLYKATITVYDVTLDKAIYTLDTSRYVSGEAK